MQELLKQGVDLDAQDEWGETALMKAASSGRTAIVQTLLEAGAAIGARDEGGYTALMGAGAGATVLLLEAGADLYARNNRGQTALLVALEDPNLALGSNWEIQSYVGRGDPKVVQLLLEAGAQVEARDAQGTTPLLQTLGMLWADPDQYLALVRSLLAHGANVNASGEGGTPLMIASARLAGYGSSYDTYYS